MATSTMDAVTHAEADVLMGGIDARLAVLEAETSSFDTWLSSPVPYLGRITGSTAGLSLTVLGLNVTGAGAITLISEIKDYINNKVAPALELKGITANA